LPTILPLPGKLIAGGPTSDELAESHALLISGAITGEPTSLTRLREAKAAVPGTAVLANTGVTADSVRDVLAVADGAIVGTALKAGGVTWNPVDPARAAQFMTAARRARESAVSV